MTREQAVERPRDARFATRARVNTARLERLRTAWQYVFAIVWFAIGLFVGDLIWGRAGGGTVHSARSA